MYTASHEGRNSGWVEGRAKMRTSLTVLPLSPTPRHYACVAEDNRETRASRRRRHCLDAAFGYSAPMRFQENRKERERVPRLAPFMNAHILFQLCLCVAEIDSAITALSFEVIFCSLLLLYLCHSGFFFFSLKSSKRSKGVECEPIRFVHAASRIVSPLHSFTLPPLFTLFACDASSIKSSVALHLVTQSSDTISKHNGNTERCAHAHTYKHPNA
jgi:hypothetical protein